MTKQNFFKIHQHMNTSFNCVVVAVGVILLVLCSRLVFNSFDFIHKTIIWNHVSHGSCFCAVSDPRRLRYAL